MKFTHQFQPLFRGGKTASNVLERAGKQAQINHTQTQHKHTPHIITIIITHQSISRISLVFLPTRVRPTLALIYHDRASGAPTMRYWSPACFSMRMTLRAVSDCSASNCCAHKKKKQKEKENKNETVIHQRMKTRRKIERQRIDRETNT